LYTPSSQPTNSIKTANGKVTDVLISKIKTREPVIIQNYVLQKPEQRIFVATVH